jgi:IS5 family transposase
VAEPLIQLANTINWTVFDDAFEQHYSQGNGRPSKPIRLMVGLLLLKQLENLSDQEIRGILEKSG